LIRFGRTTAECCEDYTDGNTLSINLMVAPCINNIKHFIVQLMHMNYKILRLLT